VTYFKAPDKARMKAGLHIGLRGKTVFYGVTYKERAKIRQLEALARTKKMHM